MNFVVAVLLLVVDEETAFWRLATLQPPCNPMHSVHSARPSPQPYVPCVLPRQQPCMHLQVPRERGGAPTARSLRA